MNRLFQLHANRKTPAGESGTEPCRTDAPYKTPQHFRRREFPWRWVLFALFLGIFVFSGIKLLSIYSAYRQGDKSMERVQETFIVPAPAEEEKPLYPTVDFASLTAQNPDAVGWIYQPDTVINYPVMKSADNDFYIHRGLDKKYQYCGSIFADYRCTAMGQDPFFVMYGHSMKNKSMFFSLLEYKKQAYYDAHPCFYYITPGQVYRLDVLAGRVVGENDPLFSLGFTGDTAQAYTEEFMTHSSFLSAATYTPGEPLAVMSTCSYENDTARYVLILKITPVG